MQRILASPHVKWSIRGLALAFLMLTLPAQAHKDRIVTVAPDGSISGLPQKFGTVVLKHAGTGTAEDVIELHVGERKVVIARCLARVLQESGAPDIRVSGSWYHETKSLPSYLNIEFDNHAASKFGRQRVSMLVHVENVRLIYIERHVKSADNKSESIEKMNPDNVCMRSTEASIS